MQEVLLMEFKGVDVRLKSQDTECITNARQDRFSKRAVRVKSLLPICVRRVKHS